MARNALQKRNVHVAQFHSRRNSSVCDEVAAFVVMVVGIANVALNLMMMVSVDNETGG